MCGCIFELMPECIVRSLIRHGENAPLLEDADDLLSIGDNLLHHAYNDLKRRCFYVLSSLGIFTQEDAVKYVESHFVDLETNSTVESTRHMVKSIPKYLENNITMIMDGYVTVESARHVLDTGRCVRCYVYNLQQRLIRSMHERLGILTGINYAYAENSDWKKFNRRVLFYKNLQVLNDFSLYFCQIYESFNDKKDYYVESSSAVSSYISFIASSPPSQSTATASAMSSGSNGKCSGSSGTLGTLMKYICVLSHL